MKYSELIKIPNIFLEKYNYIIQDYDTFVCVSTLNNNSQQNIFIIDIDGYLSIRRDDTIHLYEFKNIIKIYNRKEKIKRLFDE